MNFFRRKRRNSPFQPEKKKKVTFSPVEKKKKTLHHGFRSIHKHTNQANGLFSAERTLNTHPLKGWSRDRDSHEHSTLSRAGTRPSVGRESRSRDHPSRMHGELGGALPESSPELPMHAVQASPVTVCRGDLLHTDPQERAKTTTASSDCRPRPTVPDPGVQTGQARHEIDMERETIKQGQE